MKYCSILAILLVTICAPALAYTVYVGPPGGGDDTATLQAALNECTTPHPEGCVVQLSVGTYKTNQLVASNFQGTLKGMGMDMTTIEARPNLPVTTDVPYYTNPPSPSNPYPMLIMFQGGDITISDLFIKFTAHNATVPWYDPWGNATSTQLNCAVCVFGASANASVNRVKMEGNSIDWATWWGADGMWYYPNPPTQVPFGSSWITGKLSLTASVFKNTGAGVWVNGLLNGSVVVGGSPQAGNSFEDCIAPIYLVNLADSRADVSYNTVTRPTYVGIYLGQGWVICPTAKAVYTAQHNVINDPWWGMWVTDVDWGCDASQTHVPSQFVVSDNSFHMDPNSALGIWGALDSGTVYSNNRISGSGGWAGFWLWSTQCMVNGNNFQGYTPGVMPDGTFAPIVLDVGSNNCTVVGGSNKTNVLDWGTNNTLVGVNNMKGNPPGPAVRDAMRRKVEALMKGVPRR